MIKAPIYKEWKKDNWQVHIKNGVWTLTEDQTDWMTITQFESDLHQPHFDKAQGRVINVGLGLGFALYNFARNPNVSEVLTLEISQTLIDGFEEFTDYSDWPIQMKEKLSFKCEDSLYASEPLGKCDYLFVDTGPVVEDASMLDVARSVEKRCDYVKNKGIWSYG